MNKLEPGVLALLHGLVDATHLNDMLVEVIEAVAPLGIWIDPNGEHHFNDGGQAWACSSCGSDFDCEKWGESNTPYAIFGPRNLRPIGDNPGNESWFKAAPIEHTTPKKVAA